MSQELFVTVEVYKQDRRTKQGEQLIAKQDHQGLDKAWLTALYEKEFAAPKFRIVAQDTYVTKRNMMSNKEFQERYDTPHYCSPSSESYWSM
jgi:hypothetical protein